MQPGRHPLYPGFSPQPNLSTLQSALFSSGQLTLAAAAGAQTQTLTVPMKSSFIKGVFDSRVERVKEARPFLGGTLKPNLLKRQQRK